MKFVIVGAPKTENTRDLIDEIKTRGHDVATVRPVDFVFKVSKNELQILCNGLDLLEFDIFLLRGFTVRLMETQILTEKLISMGKTVVDETVGKTFFMSKMFEASRLTRAGLNYPKTFQILDFSSFESIKDQVEYPIIVKPAQGQKGQGIEKCEKEVELVSLLKREDQKLLVQEFLPIEGDLRVFVVGDEVLGAMMRFVPEDDFRSNASLGAKAEQVELTDEIKDIAIKATKAMDLEIAGVDLAEAHGKWFVFEANFTPQWQKFNEVTGINPAKNIIDYAINKHEHGK